MIVIAKSRHYEAGRVREVGDIYEVSEERARQLGAHVAPHDNGGPEAAVMPPDGPPADKAMKRTYRRVKVKDGSGQ